MVSRDEFRPATKGIANDAMGRGGIFGLAAEHHRYQRFHA
jgi:hypothetical protein